MGCKIAPCAAKGVRSGVAFCPVEAIDFPSRHCGQWYQSETRFGPMVHAQLFRLQYPGLLVSRPGVRRASWPRPGAWTSFSATARPASASGHRVAAVPDRSGRGRDRAHSSGVHDLERVASLCDHFRTKVAVVVNKHDPNPEHTGRIGALCTEKGYTLAAFSLPHDTAVTEAMVPSGRHRVRQPHCRRHPAGMRRTLMNLLHLISVSSNKENDSHGKGQNCSSLGSSRRT